MYRVLIIDDERAIREGLVALIDWESKGFSVVGTACDGLSALEEYDRLKPDLLLLDIKMPRLDGLSFLEALRKKGEKVHCLVLSGFAEFEYAKKAAGLQVDGYLLKPVDEEELLQYLDTIFSRLQTEGESRLLSESSPIADMTANAIVSGDLSDPDIMALQLEKAGLSWESWQVIVILPLPSSDLKIAQRLCAALKKDQDRNALSSLFVRDNYVCGFSRNIYRKGHSLNFLHASISATASSLGTSFFAAIGEVAERPSEIKASFDRALDLIQRRFFLDPDAIAFQLPSPQELFPGLPMDSSPFDGEAYAEKIAYAISIRNDRTANELLDRAARDLVSRGEDEEGIKREAALIVSHAAERLIALGESGLSRRNTIVRIIAEIQGEGSLTSLLNYISGVLPTLLSEDGVPDTARLIDRMKDVIERNYSDNLKLESLADVFRYNSAYLGKLFKAQVGTSFKTYLDEVRIRKAKEFLAQGMKVYQVAEKVGFAYVDYFHAKFKKYVGISPSTYRARYTTEEDDES